MGVLIFIGIVFFIIWLNTPSSPNTGSSDLKKSTPTYTSNKESTTSNFYSKPVVSSKPPVTTNTPASISVGSTNKKVDLVNGEYRFFENHTINGKNISFGYPKANCNNKDVWVEENGKARYISAQEADKLKSQKLIAGGSKPKIETKNNNAGYDDLPF